MSGSGLPGATSLERTESVHSFCLRMLRLYRQVRRRGGVTRAEGSAADIHNLMKAEAGSPLSHRFYSWVFIHCPTPIPG